MTETSTSEGAPRAHDASFIVEPTSAHSHSFILLHGLGSNGAEFGRELMGTGVTREGKHLMEIFPGVRFIFPTSKRRRSSAFGRAKLTQWFNIASLSDPSFRNHTQLQGLEESFQSILAILTEESRKVDATRIILGGLSQGCAMALICLLTFEAPVGAFIGMSGWLPFRQEIESTLQPTMEEDLGDDPFIMSNDSADGDEQSHPAVGAVEYVRDLVSIPMECQDVAEAIKRIPVFLGHGSMDEKINHSLGEDACRVMSSIGFHVDWRSYPGQGHWYKIPDEIEDIVAFIENKVG